MRHPSSMGRVVVGFALDGRHITELAGSSSLERKSTRLNLQSEVRDERIFVTWLAHESFPHRVIRNINHDRPRSSMQDLASTLPMPS